MRRVLLLLAVITLHDNLVSSLWLYVRCDGGLVCHGLIHHFTLDYLLIQTVGCLFVGATVNR